MDGVVVAVRTAVVVGCLEFQNVTNHAVGRKYTRPEARCAIREKNMSYDSLSLPVHTPECGLSAMPTQLRVDTVHDSAEPSTRAQSFSSSVAELPSLVLLSPPPACPRPGDATGANFQQVPPTAVNTYGIKCLSRSA